MPKHHSSAHHREEARKAKAGGDMTAYHRHMKEAKAAKKK